MQGGRLLHALDNETCLKPRIYMGNLANNDETDMSLSPDRGAAYKKYLVTDNADAEESPPSERVIADQVDQFTPKPLTLPGNYQSRLGKGRMTTDHHMTEQNRHVLRRFEALNVDGQTLTELSIGGYTVDLARAAQKVKEITPLPPARLPIIFLDGDMNFYHHVFQGLEILLGRGVMLRIIETKQYNTHEDPVLLPMIEEMIKKGYERTDTEVTVFAKKVLTTTYEIDSNTTSDAKEHCLLVAANLWGFQYIEAGMQCHEGDLRMWLSISYNHYRTLWFNTFKSSGVPAFALEGVQTRYESPEDSTRTTRSYPNPREEKSSIRIISEDEAITVQGHTMVPIPRKHKRQDRHSHDKRSRALVKAGFFM